MFCANCGNALDTRNQTADAMIRCPVCGMNQPVPAQAYEQPVRRYRQTTGSYTPPQDTYAPPADSYAPADTYAPPVPQQRSAYAPPVPQQRSAYAPPASSYTPQFAQPVPAAPAPAPVRTVSTGRRVLGIFSLIIGLAVLLFDIFYIINSAGSLFSGRIPSIPSGFVTLSLILAIIGVIFGGIGKGGCHVAGLVLSIISLVLSLILFIIVLIVYSALGGSFASMFNFSTYNLNDALNDIYRYAW